MRELLVVGLGGNALSPPERNRPGYDDERRRIARTGRTLHRLAQRHRLLIVHGNGPQVGKLLEGAGPPADLDVRTAQTQGELGYLLSAALPGAVSIVTRVRISDPPGEPIKAIGPVLSERPQSNAIACEGGWRVCVPSPRPEAVIERPAIGALLESHHVIAGGGGGIPVDGEGQPLNVVVDKDWVASLLAVELGAAALLLATNVDGVYERFGEADARCLSTLTTRTCRDLDAAGQLGSGSMRPKVLSAAEYVDSTGREARICALEDIEPALAGRAGSRIVAVESTDRAGAAEPPDTAHSDTRKPL